MKSEPKLIEIEKAEKVIFVGDTHGNSEASQKVIKGYLKEGNKIVFLGDYVDRGPNSKENLDFLLEQRERHSQQVFLLQGNHEGHRILPFFPADFWRSLNQEEYQQYSLLVEKLPLICIVKNIIALHGVLPNIKSTKPSNIDKIKLGSQEWRQVVWGDFVDEPGEDLGIDISTGRPKFGRDYFFKLMKRFDKKVLIRSHQANAPQIMFEDRCLTIFTSAAYNRERTIAILDFKREIKNVKDLGIKRI